MSAGAAVEDAATTSASCGAAAGSSTSVEAETSVTPEDACGGGGA